VIIQKGRVPKILLRRNQIKNQSKGQQKNSGEKGLRAKLGDIEFESSTDSDSSYYDSTESDGEIESSPFPTKRSTNKGSKKSSNSNTSTSSGAIRAPPGSGNSGNTNTRKYFSF